MDFDQIGLVRLIQSNATMLIPLSVLGMSGSIIKYYPAVKNDPSVKDAIITLQILILVCSNFIILLISTIFYSEIASLFIEKSPAYVDYLTITVLILVFQSTFEYLFSIARSELDVIFPSFLKEVLLRGGNMVLVVSYGFNLINFTDFISVLALLYLVNTGIFLLFLFIKKKLRFNFKFNRLKGSLLKQVANYSGYTLMLSIGVSIITNISYVMTSSYLGLEANGIFTTCMFIGIIIEMPKRAMNLIVGPLISNSFKKNNGKEIENIYQRASLNLSIIGLLLTIGIITNINDFFSIVPKGAQLADGLWVVIAVAISKLSAMFFGPSGELLMYSKLKNFMLYFMLTSAVLIILLNWLLIPIFGLNGAALAFLITSLADQIFRFILIRSQMKIKLFIINHLKLFAIGGMTIWIFTMLPIPFTEFYAIPIRAVLTTVVFLGMVYTFSVSSEFNLTLKKLIHRFL
ncbi:lipopolysaccharide biosynthesis protein [Marinoscillum sp.]|uniref:lipopolysaccharide biosynthesis protein n=1 Tax=Marinoscillum sp. TaxID=2024838 RepID=UPI003BAC2AEA